MYHHGHRIFKEKSIKEKMVRRTNSHSFFSPYAAVSNNSDSQQVGTSSSSHSNNHTSSSSSNNIANTLLQQEAIDALSEASGEVGVMLDHAPNPQQLDNMAFDVVINSEPVSLEELIHDTNDTTEYDTCFGCKYINADSIQSNTLFLNLMRLYTQNQTMVARTTIFKEMKRYYDEFIRQDLPDGDHELEWPVDKIREHFTKHTSYPTDEIQLQLAINRSLRTRLSNHVIVKNREGDDGPTETKFHLENIKTLLALQKEIQTLLRMRKDVPTMHGYNSTLDF